MGFRISWIAIRADRAVGALASLGLAKTNKKDAANEAPFSGAVIAGDWYLIFSNDLDFASSENAKALSDTGAVIACEVDEHEMRSAAFEYRRGAKTWSVLHNAQLGDSHLEVQGTPPESFPRIRETLLESHDRESASGSAVDFVFEIPIAVAEDVTNYRHDRWKFEWGEPDFRELRPATLKPKQGAGNSASIDPLFFDKVASIVSRAGFTQRSETLFELKDGKVSVVIEYRGTVRKTHFHLSPMLYVDLADQLYQINFATLGIRFNIDRSSMISTYTQGDNRAEYCLVFEDTFTAFATKLLPKLKEYSSSDAERFVQGLGMKPMLTDKLQTLKR